jgi:hypothetical protein
MDCFVASLLAMTEERVTFGVIGLSGQIAFAAEPDAVLRFHLRHLKQTYQHAQPVPPR